LPTLLGAARGGNQRPTRSATRRTCHLTNNDDMAE
jgi:hypothetical protein